MDLTLLGASLAPVSPGLLPTPIEPQRSARSDAVGVRTRMKSAMALPLGFLQVRNTPHFVDDEDGIDGQWVTRNDARKRR